MHAVHLRLIEKRVVDLLLVITSVVTDSESATESADSSRVRPSPNPRIFCGRT